MSLVRRAGRVGFHAYRRTKHENGPLTLSGSFSSQDKKQHVFGSAGRQGRLPPAARPVRLKPGTIDQSSRFECEIYFSRRRLTRDYCPILNVIYCAAASVSGHCPPKFQGRQTPAEETCQDRRQQTDKGTSFPERIGRVLILSLFLSGLSCTLSPAPWPGGARFSGYSCYVSLSHQRSFKPH